MFHVFRTCECTHIHTHTDTENPRILHSSVSKPLLCWSSPLGPAGRSYTGGNNVPAGWVLDTGPTVPLKGSYCPAPHFYQPLIMGRGAKFWVRRYPAYNLLLRTHTHTHTSYCSHSSHYSTKQRWDWGEPPPPPFRLSTPLNEAKMSAEQRATTALQEFTLKHCREERENERGKNSPTFAFLPFPSLLVLSTGYLGPDRFLSESPACVHTLSCPCG